MTSDGWVLITEEIRRYGEGLDLYERLVYTYRIFIWHNKDSAA